MCGLALCYKAIHNRALGWLFLPPSIEINLMLRVSVLLQEVDTKLEFGHPIIEPHPSISIASSSNFEVFNQSSLNIAARPYLLASNAPLLRARVDVMPRALSCDVLSETLTDFACLLQPRSTRTEH